MKHEILSWNTFTLVSKFHYVRFSSLKNIVFTEKRYIFYIKQKPKKFQKAKPYLNETMIEKQELQKSCNDTLLELRLTN